MSHLATGNGYIRFNKELSKTEWDTVYAHLDGPFSDSMSETDDKLWLHHSSDWNYHDEEVEKALFSLIPFGIKEGAIEFIGEDESLWRYIFRDGKWVEENGHVEYGEMTVDKVKAAFMAYVMADPRTPEEIRKCLEAIGVSGLFQDDFWDMKERCGNGNK